jgi:hypothetical protein
MTAGIGQIDLQGTYHRRQAMPAHALPVRATSSLFERLFRRKSADVTDIREVKRRLRIELVDLPDYLKRDIGLFDD